MSFCPLEEAVMFLFERRELVASIVVDHQTHTGLGSDRCVVDCRDTGFCCGGAEEEE